MTKAAGQARPVRVPVPLGPVPLGPVPLGPVPLGPVPTAEPIPSRGPTAQTKYDRISRRHVDKFSQRRDELAHAALDTLAELGYARTSLREIAQNSAFSHGVLHYYFADKVDLITHCVKHYKAICVSRYDQILADAETADRLADGFARGLAITARHDAALHRLWYDMRSQSMFEPAFRADVLAIDDSLQRMIWRVVGRYGELRHRRLIVDPAGAYAVFDGLFQQALLRHTAGAPSALDELTAHVRDLLPNLVSTAADAPAG